jgi:Xaa-Pro aminopeptidase
VTRVFPVNGRFTPRQREYYGIYLKLYQALLTSIAVHKTPGEVTATAAPRMVDGLRVRKNPRGLGHNVGLEVHDVGGLQADTFEPGRVFTIEPQMRLEDEHLGARLEDMILITDTGYENMSAPVPIEVADIERVMAERR